MGVLAISCFEMSKRFEKRDNKENKRLRCDGLSMVLILLIEVIINDWNRRENYGASWFVMRIKDGWDITEGASGST